MGAVYQILGVLALICFRTATVCFATSHRRHSQGFLGLGLRRSKNRGGRRQDFKTFDSQTADMKTSEGMENKHVLDNDGVVRADDSGRSAWALLPPTASEHHASQLMVYTRSSGQAQGGWELLCAWFSGVEGRGTVSLMVSRLGSDGSSWSKPEVAAMEPERSLQNPTWLWDNGTDSIRLMYTSQTGANQGTSSVHGVESRDGGQSWSAHSVLLDEPGAFLKNAPIRSRDGRSWLLPMYYTPKGLAHVPSQWSALRSSEDGGRTWSTLSNMSLQGSGLVQPSVVRAAASPGGEPSPRLVAFFRSRRRDSVWRAESPDDGATWSVPARTPLPNCNKAVQALRLRSGALALVFNNNRGKSAGLNRGGNRRGDSKLHPLSVGLSHDDGLTWPHVRDLEPEFDTRLEYTYPSIVQTPDGGIHVTYTWSHARRRVAIRYMRFDEEWVRGSWAWGATRGVYQPVGRQGSAEN